MKWSKLFIVKLHDEERDSRSYDIIDQAARDYQAAYQVPNHRMFTNVRDQHSDYESQQDGVYEMLNSESLKGLTLQDKLMICAHGNESSLGPYKSAQDLTDALYGWGLRQVGLITFKACLVGQGYFLDEFRNCCCAKGMMIGWVKGYKGSTATMPRFLFFGKPVEDVSGASWIFWKGRQVDRLRIVKGNADIKAPSDRFANAAGPRDLI